MWHLNLFSRTRVKRNRYALQEGNSLSKLLLPQRWFVLLRVTQSDQAIIGCINNITNLLLHVQMLRPMVSAVVSYHRNTNRDGLSCCVSHNEIRTITGCINSTTTLLTQMLKSLVSAVESYQGNSTNRDGLSCCVSYSQIRTITGCVNNTLLYLLKCSDHLSQYM